jgi:WD40 repeat protein
VDTLKGHSGEVLSVKFSANEQFLLSCGADMEVLLWSMLTKSVSRRLLGHADAVYW